jgi:hypothetical protein
MKNRLRWESRIALDAPAAAVSSLIQIKDGREPASVEYLQLGSMVLEAGTMPATVSLHVKGL